MNKYINKNVWPPVLFIIQDICWGKKKKRKQKLTWSVKWSGRHCSPDWGEAFISLTPGGEREALETL